MEPPPKKGKGALIGVIVAVVVIVVVLLVLFLFVFKGQSQLVGKWNIESAEYGGQTVTLPAGSYFEFKSDGTVTVSMTIPPAPAQTMSGHYEDLGGGKVKFKNGGEQTVDYSVSGNTLTISYGGSTLTCTKA